MVDETIRKYFDGFIKPSNRRKRLPHSVLRDVRSEINKLKQTKFKHKANSQYYWKDNPASGIPINVDLPILVIDKENEIDLKKVPRPRKIPKKFINVHEGCIVVNKEGRILSVFMTEKEDPNIAKLNRFTEELCVLMDVYYPEKVHTFYFASSIFKPKKKNPQEYYGKNWVDGLIKYLHGPIGKGVVTYKNRKPEANDDNNFLFILSYLFAGLYELERQHIPQVGNYRKFIAKDIKYPGCIPGLPIDLLPATTIGGSTNFASRYHNDSTIKGITETIIWIPPKKGFKQVFVNYTAGVNFHLQTNCIMYIPGNIVHGTADTGKHGGCGFVNITKRNLVTHTEFNTKWYKEWRKVNKEKYKL